MSGTTRRTGKSCPACRGYDGWMNVCAGCHHRSIHGKKGCSFMRKFKQGDKRCACRKFVPHVRKQKTTFIYRACVVTIG